LFVFISGTMRFSRYGLGASDLATHNHTAIPEVTQGQSRHFVCCLRGTHFVEIETVTDTNTFF
jgi:hypothetical protein